MSMSKQFSARRGLGERPIQLSKTSSYSGSDQGSNPASGRVSTSSYRFTHGYGAEKRLDIPYANSSTSQQKLIEKAIESIAKLPDKIEKEVSRKVVDPKIQRSLLQKATRTLNVPKKGRIYHDLVDIATVPPIQVKKAPPYEQKPTDPTPLITDYNKAEYITIPPPSSFPAPLSYKRDRRPNLIDFDSYFNPNDFLQYERMYTEF